MARKLRNAAVLAAMLSAGVVSNGTGTAAGAGPSALCTMTGLPSESQSVVVPHVVNATVNTCADERTPPNQACSVGADQSVVVELGVSDCTPPLPGPGGVPALTLPSGPGGGGGASPPPAGSSGTGSSSPSAPDAGATPPVGASVPNGPAAGPKPAAQRASAARAVIRSMRLSASRRRIAVVVQCTSATQICNTQVAVYVRGRRVTRTLGSSIRPRTIAIYGLSLTPTGIRAVRRGIALRGVAVTTSLYGQVSSASVLRV
jgi:hypothetical protein